MIPMLWPVLLLAPLLGRGDPALPQGEDSVLVTYDLRAVMPRWDAGTSWSQSLLVPPAATTQSQHESIDASLEYAELASFELLDLLTQILSDELRREGRELLVEGHVLTVLAPPSLHEQVRSILETLEQALAGTMPVRVDMLDLAEGGELPAAGLLGAEEASALVATLVARGAAHQSYTLELSAGRTAYLDAYRRVPFLFDYDVEVAQSMVVFGPVMSATRDGVRLVLRGLAQPGGMTLSSVLLSSRLLGPIQKRALLLKGIINHPEGGSTKVVDGPDGIQSPEVLVRGLAFDAFLPDGKALALTAESSLGKARSRELVLIRRLGGAVSSYVVRPIPRTNRTLIVLDAELFRVAGLLSVSQPWADDQGVLQPSVVASFDGTLSGFLLEWMKARFSVWRRFGPWILVVTDPAWDRDAPAQLERLVKSLRPATSMRQVGIDLRSIGAEPAVPVRLRLAVLDGTSAGLVLARSGTAVTGFDAQVAQGASVPDPYVSSVFEGLALTLDVRDTTLEVRGMGQLVDTSIAAFETGYALLGPIDCPQPRLLHFDERVQLSEGRPGPVRIGGAPERGEGQGLVLEVSLAPLAR